ncbi:hypothetical protein W911_03595 [Hyphomicrobium nitrativorans NL23]|uniref:Uncharacterized protein n=1 Tax=Hyphomicrobium nitrativorans NL23 TaxID=1029756 RepID=V5SCK3_9HYPH|nr:hypothetical protein W911_03595 [Hyphomicrobium nitrativorans NL23]
MNRRDGEDRSRTPSLPNEMIWLLFGFGALLATAPVWRLAIYGYNPSVDELLRVICMVPR